MEDSFNALRCASLASFLLALTLLGSTALADRNRTYRGTNGLIVFTSQNGGTGARDLFVAYADGKGRRRLTSSADPEERPSFSPNGRKIAFVRQHGTTYDLFVINADGTGETRLTRDGSHKNEFEWSPDGTRIVFSDGASNVKIVGADGRGLRTLAAQSSVGGDITVYGDPTFSPDGTRIAMSMLRASEQRIESSIVTIAPDGTARATLLTLPTLTLISGLFYSPDGARIVYNQETPFDTPTGTDFRSEVFVKSTADQRAGTRISGGGTTADEVVLDWSPAANRLLFTSTVTATGTRTVLTMRPDGGDRRQITSITGTNERTPVFSPDGTRVAYFRFAPGVFPQGGAFTARLDGSDERAFSPREDRDASWGVLVGAVPTRDVLRIDLATTFAGLPASYTLDGVFRTGDIDVSSARISGTGTIRSSRNRDATITFALTRAAGRWSGTLRIVEPTVIDTTIDMAGATIDPVWGTGSHSRQDVQVHCPSRQCIFVPTTTNIVFQLDDRP